MPGEPALPALDDRRFLKRFAWLSIGAAAVTIGLKTTAYLLTGSVGLLLDAVESLVNLAGALMALAMLTIAARTGDEVALVRQILDAHITGGAQYHALRTRESGARAFVSFHVLVPGSWTVHRGHGLLEQVEGAIRHRLPNATVFTHLESLDDPASWEDQQIDRPRQPRA